MGLGKADGHSAAGTPRGARANPSPHILGPDAATKRLPGRRGRRRVQGRPEGRQGRPEGRQSRLAARPGRRPAAEPGRWEPYANQGSAR